jgi:hypothetical protein
MSDSRPCQCWFGGTAIHHGHCCFDGPVEQFTATTVPCGHYDGIPNPKPGDQPCHADVLLEIANSEA